jgi:DNA mismatch repair protein MutS
MSKKIVELYFEVQEEQTKKFDKIGRKKIAVIYQVGSFYEFYGLEYNDGTKKGIIWQLADELGLKIAVKKDQTYNDDDTIKVYMAGIPLCSKEKYCQIADRLDWTIILLGQKKVGSKLEREIIEITSPGINISTDAPSNITISILLESVRNYNTSSNLFFDTHTIYGSIAYLDCITGENGVVNIKPQSNSNNSILLDEILKTIIVKNPKHINIYLQNYNLEEEVLINAFHLYRTSYTIFRDTIDIKYETIAYQETIFNNFYTKEKGLLSIVQQLDLEDANLIHCRVILVLLLEYIALHDKSIINLLNKPKIAANSNDFLILGNNPLEQLDVINNMRNDIGGNQIGLGKRISLLELLNKTKTPMGYNEFRNRLSNPITSVHELNLRYDQIEEMHKYHNLWLIDNPTDTFGSPLYLIRNTLSNIKNIENIIRKIITNKFTIPEIEIFFHSLDNSIQLGKLVKKITNKKEYPILLEDKKDKQDSQSLELNTEFQTNSNIFKLVPNLELISIIYNEMQNTFNFNEFKYLWIDIENNIFKSGINSELDDLQQKINDDRHFLDNLINRLSIIIDRAINLNSQEYKKNPSATNFEKNKYITEADNSQKGIHLVIIKKYKDILEQFLSKEDPARKCFNIGNYTIKPNDIKFIPHHNKFIIQVEQLKISANQLSINIEKLQNECRKYFTYWIKHLITRNNNQSLLIDLCKFIQNIDIIQSATLSSIENGYIRPKIVSHSHSYIDVKDIRHPIIEKINKSTQYITNDVSMGKDKTGILLFGVNAVGKSSLMKSIGINIILAQAGFFVAASEFTFQPYLYLFTRIKNNDNLYAGLSSFEVEMKEFKIILQYADENSIILGDELCSGTETQDATALVTSGIIQLSKRNSSFIFATHLHFLAESPYLKTLSETTLKLCHLRVDLDPSNSNKLVYSRKLMDGSGPKSYGILVCESMNLEGEFIELAKEIRENMNSKNNLGSIGNIARPPSPSKYNPEKMLHICEICGDVGVDVHHINQQCDADLNGMLEGGFHKNSKWNLVSLCKECHIDIHSRRPKVEIVGYIQTSSGIVLEWKKKSYENTRVSNTSSNNEMEENSNKIIVKKPASPPPSYNSIVEDSSIITVSELENSASVSLSSDNDSIENSDININDVVRKLKNEGKTVKMIQYNIKKKYGLTIAIKEIREVV